MRLAKFYFLKGSWTRSLSILSRLLARGLIFLLHQPPQKSELLHQSQERLFLYTIELLSIDYSYQDENNNLL